MFYVANNVKYSQKNKNWKLVVPTKKSRLPQLWISLGEFLCPQSICVCSDSHTSCEM